MTRDVTARTEGSVRLESLSICVSARRRQFQGIEAGVACVGWDEVATDAQVYTLLTNRVYWLGRIFINIVIALLQDLTPQKRRLNP